MTKYSKESTTSKVAKVSRIDAQWGRHCLFQRIPLAWTRYFGRICSI